MEASLRSERLARPHGMAHSRRDELEQMLEARCQAIEDQAQQKIRAFRDTPARTTRPADDLSGIRRKKISISHSCRCRRRRSSTSWRRSRGFAQAITASAMTARRRFPRSDCTRCRSRRGACCARSVWKAPSDASGGWAGGKPTPAALRSLTQPPSVAEARSVADSLVSGCLRNRSVTYSASSWLRCIV